MEGDPIHGNTGEEHPSHRIDFAGVPVDVLRAKDIVERVGDLCRANGRVHTLLYLNAHTFAASTTDTRHLEALRSADLVYPDGMSIVWVSRLMGTPLPEKLTLSDIIYPIAEYAASQGYGIFMLGGEPGLAETAGRVLKERYPALRIVGSHHGFFAPEENDRIIGEINRCKPSILFVGMGAPHQEKWVLQNQGKLQVPVCVPCGGLFGYLSGNVRRAPRWMSEHGLEWMFRLLMEPRRLWKRYSYENARFLWSIGKHLLTRNGHPRDF